MQLFLFLLLIGLLAIIAYQDIKNREVHLFIYLGFFGLSLFYKNEFLISITNLFTNTIYVVVIFSLVAIYFRWIKKDKEAFLNHKIGIGDFVYLIAIAPLFHFINYMLYVNIALIISLIIHLIITNWIARNSLKTIPLAGYMSICLILLLMVLNYYAISLHDLSFIESKLNY